MGPPASDRVSRVRSYSGYTLTASTFRLRGFHPLRRTFPESFDYASTAVVRAHNPVSKLTVWALSRSLAATGKIDLSFSSWGYLDVSVHPVAFAQAMEIGRAHV